LKHKEAIANSKALGYKKGQKIGININIILLTYFILEIKNTKTNIY